MPIGAYRIASYTQGGGGSGGGGGTGGGSKFLAVSSQTTPFITIYSRTDDTFTKLSNPASLPGGNSQSSCRFDRQVSGGVVSSGLLATTQGTSPYINTYTISGTTFTKNADPATPPAGEAHQIAFSPDSMLAVAHDGSPFLSVYTADRLKLNNPSILPSGNGEGVAWNGRTRVAIGGAGASPSISVYSVSGQAPASTLARVANFTVGGGQIGYSLAYTSTGSHLAVAHDVSPYVTVFSISGDTYTKVSDPATLPTGNVRGVAWNPDGTSLAVAHTTSPFVTIYNRSGNTLTKVANPPDLPAGNGTMVSWSADGTSLAVAHATSPFVTIYNRSGDTFTKVANPATLPPSSARGVDFSS